MFSAPESGTKKARETVANAPENSRTLLGNSIEEISIRQFASFLSFSPYEKSRFGESLKLVFEMGGARTSLAPGGNLSEEASWFEPGGDPGNVGEGPASWFSFFCI